MLMMMMMMMMMMLLMEKNTPNAWLEGWFLIGFATLPDISNKNCHAVDFEPVIIRDATNSDR